MYKLVKVNHFMDVPHPNGINNGFERTGEMLKEPTIGECFYLGTLRTSPVTEITEGGFKTKNSEYKLTKI